MLLPLMALSLAGCNNENKDEGAPYEISAKNFPDDGFRDYIRAYFDLDGDGWLSKEELQNAKQIAINLDDNNNAAIPFDLSSLKGIEHFENLVYFGYRHSHLEVLADEVLDLTKNRSLTFVELICRVDSMRLDLHGLPSLRVLNLGKIVNSPIAGIDGSPSYDEGDYCDGFYRIDVSDCPSLQEIYLRSYYNSSYNSNRHQYLDASGCVSLKKAEYRTTVLISCAANFAGCKSLESLDFSNAFGMVALDLSDCEALKEMTLPYSTSDYDFDVMGIPTNDRFNLDLMPEGFDLSRASNWQGARIEGNTLVFTGEIFEDGRRRIYYCTYDYDTRCPNPAFSKVTVRLRYFNELK